MTPAELEIYLHTHIPLSKAMGVSVLENGDRVVLHAPLAPNINHRGSAFGGSEASLALLAGWAWMRERVTGEANLVIASSRMTYSKPATGDFIAVCDGDGAGLIAEHFNRKGRARKTLTIILYCNDQEVARMEGDFAAIASAS